MMKRIIALFLTAIMMVSLATGCTGYENDSTKDEGEDNQKVIGDGSPLVDNDLLYANDDDTSVITMYLTVSSGNSAENTNHTWTEVNSYSVYDYEAMGVERYAVNGLLQVGDENGPTEGELGYGMYIPNAVVTIRGQSSSQGRQKSYKIELQDGKGEWNGQKVINLNKHVFDGVRFRNKLMYDLLEELPGLVALQTQFVHLYVKDETAGGNGEFVDYGLYTQVEQPNKSFLKRHGFDSYGHLYKLNTFEFYRYEDIIMLRSDADYDEAAFEELIEIKGDNDHSKLIAMLEDVNNEMLPTDEVIDKWFEKDNLLSWLAFQIITGNIDTTNRNTLLYSPLNYNTWYFISWDCDAAFCNKELEVTERDASGTWQTGVSNYWGNMLLRRVLKDTDLRQSLDEKIQEYRSILTEEYLAKKVKSYAKVVKPYAYGAADVGNIILTPEEYDVVCDAIPKEIEQNYNSYLESLEKPMPFFIGVPVMMDNRLHIQWDSSYDFDMEMVTYEVKISKNFDMSNPICEVSGLQLPEYVYEGALEPGQYFVQVIAKNESGYTQCAFDNYNSVEYGTQYGVKCFYVLEDGSIVEDTYYEE